MSPHLLPVSFAVPQIANFELTGEPPPLGQPTDLAASASGTSVVLTWVDNAPNADGYKILRATALLASDDDFTEIASVLKVEGEALETFTDPTGQAETLFCYRVQAFEGTRVSVVSKTACATTG